MPIKRKCAVGLQTKVLISTLYLLSRFDWILNLHSQGTIPTCFFKKVAILKKWISPKNSNSKFYFLFSLSLCKTCLSCLIKKTNLYLDEIHLLHENDEPRTTTNKITNNTSLHRKESRLLNWWGKVFLRGIFNNSGGGKCKQEPGLLTECTAAFDTHFPECRECEKVRCCQIMTQSRFKLYFPRK